MGGLQFQIDDCTVRDRAESHWKRTLEYIHKHMQRKLLTEDLRCILFTSSKTNVALSCTTCLVPVWHMDKPYMTTIKDNLH